MLLPSDTGDDLADDFVAVITSITARISGRARHARGAAPGGATSATAIRRRELVTALFSWYTAALR